MHQPHATRDDAPGDHDATQVNGRARLGEEQVARDLEDDVRDEEDDERERVIIRGQLEIALHSRDFCIANAGRDTSILPDGGRGTEYGLTLFDPRTRADTSAKAWA